MFFCIPASCKKILTLNRLLRHSQQHLKVSPNNPFHLSIAFTLHLIAYHFANYLFSSIFSSLIQACKQGKIICYLWARGFFYKTYTPIFNQMASTWNVILILAPLRRRWYSFPSNESINWWTKCAMEVYSER